VYRLGDAFHGLGADRNPVVHWLARQLHHLATRVLRVLINRLSEVHKMTKLNDTIRLISLVNGDITRFGKKDGAFMIFRKISRIRYKYARPGTIFVRNRR
jgi:hypothetical protein